MFGKISLKKLFHKTALALALTGAVQTGAPIGQDFHAAAEEVGLFTNAGAKEGASLSEGFWSQPDVFKYVQDIHKTKDGKEKLLEVARQEPAETLRRLPALKNIVPDFADKMRLAACNKKLVEDLTRAPEKSPRFFAPVVETPIAKDVLALMVKDDPVDGFYVMGRTLREYEGADKKKIQAFLTAEARKLVRAHPDAVRANPDVFSTMTFGVECIREILTIAPEAAGNLSEESLKKIFPPRNQSERKALEEKIQKAIVAKIKAKDRFAGENLINVINGHDKESEAVRAKLLAPYNAEDAFFLLSLSSLDMHRATYRSLQDKMHTALGEEGLSPLDLVQRPTLKDYVGTFIRALSQSGQLNRFFAASRTQMEEKKLAREMVGHIVKPYIEGIEELKEEPLFFEENGSINHLSQMMNVNNSSSPAAIATGLADVLTKMKRPIAQESGLDALENLYKNTTDPILKDTIGCAVSIFYALPDSTAEPHRFFVKEEKITEKYLISVERELPESALFKKGKCTVLMRFYADNGPVPDSQDSFEHMLTHYRSNLKQKSGWRVQEQKDVVYITNEVNPQRNITIVAIPPKAADAFAENDGMEKLFKKERPTVTVIRGHTEKLNDLYGSERPTALAMAGSCNGYAAMPAIKRAFFTIPTIVTEGTGYMGANEVLVSSLLERARDKGSIKWEDLWKQVNKDYAGEGFDHYIRPDKNIYTLVQSHLDRFLARRDRDQITRYSPIVQETSPPRL